MNAPIILTDRLIINELVSSDAPHLFAYRSHPDVTRFQSWLPSSVADAEQFIAQNARTTFDHPGSWYQLAIRLHNTRELSGDIGLHFVGDGQQTEIGFTISPTHQRKGFGQEAVSSVLTHLFETLRKHRVFASVDPRNHGSLALLQKVGMRQEAHFRESLFWKGEWVDDIVFAILRREWSRIQL